MIRSIRGEITEKGKDYLCLLSASGIEWELIIDSRTAASLPPVGEAVCLPVYLYHREDSMQLFGFSGEKERRLFLDLLKVSGVGPKQAMKVLAGMRVEEFIGYLESGDLTALSGIPGMGKATAGKVILALRGKLSLPDEETSDDSAELIRALVEMGFDKTKAKGAVEAASRAIAEQTVPQAEREKEILKQAIVKLSS